MHFSTSANFIFIEKTMSWCTCAALCSKQSALSWTIHQFENHGFILTVFPSLSSTGLCWVQAGSLLQGNDSAWSATHSPPRRPRRQQQQQQVWRRDSLPYHTELTLQPLKTSGPNRLPSLPLEPPLNIFISICSPSSPCLLRSGFSLFSRKAPIINGPGGTE